MTDLDDLIARLREIEMRDNEMQNHYVRRLLLDRLDAAAALEALRDEVARLRKLDVEYGRVEVAIIMADHDFDGDSDHENCGDRLIASIQRMASRAAPADQTTRNIPCAGSWEDGDTVFNIKKNTVTHRFEGGRWVSQE